MNCTFFLCMCLLIIVHNSLIAINNFHNVKEYFVVIWFFFCVVYLTSRKFGSIRFVWWGQQVYFVGDITLQIKWKEWVDTLKTAVFCRRWTEQSIRGRCWEFQFFKNVWDCCTVDRWRGQKVRKKERKKLTLCTQANSRQPGERKEKGLSCCCSFKLKLLQFPWCRDDSWLPWQHF